MAGQKTGGERGSKAEKRLSQGAREFLGPAAASKGGERKGEEEARRTALAGAPSSQESALVPMYKAIFTRDSYKTLLAVTLVVLLVAIAIAAVRPPEPDIDLKGGLSITVTTASAMDAGALEAALQQRFGTDLRLRVLKDPLTGEQQLVVEAGGAPDKDALVAEIGRQLGTPLPEGSYNIRTVSPTISGATFTGARRAVALSFVLMGCCIFILFREPVFSAAVILSAFTDVAETYAAMSLLGMRLSLPAIAALLMLIGYSVESNILMTSRIVQRREREQAVLDVIHDAFPTGFMMTATALVALASVLLLSTASVLREIAAILAIGLVLDIVATWVQNAAVIVWHLEGGAE